MHDVELYGDMTKSALISEFSSVDDYPIFLIYATEKEIGKDEYVGTLIIK